MDRFRISTSGGRLGRSSAHRVRGCYLSAAVLGGFAAVGDGLGVSSSWIESKHEDFAAYSNIFALLRIVRLPNNYATVRIYTSARG
jgi:hypothetical protein